VMAQHHIGAGRELREAGEQACADRRAFRSLRYLPGGRPDLRGSNWWRGWRRSSPPPAHGWTACTGAGRVGGVAFPGVPARQPPPKCSGTVGGLSAARRLRHPGYWIRIGTYALRIDGGCGPS
jgi:hypothetical protein